MASSYLSLPLRSEAEARAARAWAKQRRECCGNCQHFSPTSCGMGRCGDAGPVKGEQDWCNGHDPVPCADAPGEEAAARRDR